LPTGGWAIALRNFRKYFENANLFAAGVGAGSFWDAKSASDIPTFIQPVNVKIPHPWSNNKLCADVIVGQEFLKRHAYITFVMKGPEESLNYKYANDCGT